MLQYRLKQIDFDGQFEYSDIVEVNINGVQQFILEQNYPNPFNPETTIKYSVPSGVETSYPEESRQVMTSLRVYDILGREIATLVNEAKLPGNYSIKFSIKEFDKERPLSNSIYFYKLQAGNFIQVKKMILMK
ncbi:MAG: T9SS type A sorting domain-containing protein [Melioribacteraceae bacterium]|nr:T9SS type A sorting domain-containing protein [Melioribacteraceae bacterium]